MQKPLSKPYQFWLQGITILDLSSLLPCPFAAHLLAKFGARVIKIESPNRLDPARNFGYIPQNESTSSCYREINTIKELLLLDLKSENDRKNLYSLVQHTHGAIEGYRPEVRKRLGIEYEKLAQINPAFVYCSVGGFSQASTHQNRAGHDINFLAKTGILGQTRDQESNCVMLGAPIGDYLVAYNAAFRMACALYSAKQTGVGMHVELTIEDTLLEAQMPFLREAFEEKPLDEKNLVSGKYPCYQIYNLSEGSFALGALEEKFWIEFCQTISRPDLISGQFAVGEDCLKIVKEVTQTLQKRSFYEWKVIFSEVDCCIEPILSVKEVLDGLQST